jgi:hypothetical protein
VTRPPKERGGGLPTRAQLWAAGWAALLFVLLSLTFTKAAQAQWERPEGWHRFSLGAGPATARSALTPAGREGIAGLAAFELVAREHLELRFSATLFEGRDRAETQLGGVALDAVVFPWRGAVQPYAGAGVGAYQLIVEDADPLAADARRDFKALAGTAVAGARVRLGPVTPFVEWRHTVFAADAPMRHYAPWIAGLHF